MAKKTLPIKEFHVQLENGNEFRIKAACFHVDEEGCLIISASNSEYDWPSNIAGFKKWLMCREILDGSKI